MTQARRQGLLIGPILFALSLACTTPRSHDDLERHSTATNTSLTVSAAADTFVYEQDPLGQFGQSPDLQVGGPEHQRDIMLRFEVNGLPDGAVVTGAELVLTTLSHDQSTGYADSSVSGGTVHPFEPVDPGWSEDAPTWESPLIGTVGDALAALGPVTFDEECIFAGLEAAVAGNGPVTLLVRAEHVDGAWYHSSESADPTKRPRLTVGYSIDAGSGSGAGAGGGATSGSTGAGEGGAGTTSSTGSTGSGAGPSGPVELGVAGRRFTIDGTPTFLLSVSYYGALAVEAAAMEADLDGLAARGFNNVRVFVTYWDDGAPSVFDANGSLDAPAMQKLEQLLAAARDRGMTVDVTFAEYWYSLPAYRAGIVAVATQLLGYRNAFFDVANEHNYPDVGQVVLSAAEVEEIANAVRAVDASRPLTASTVCPYADAACFALSAVSGSFASPHFPRGDTWSEDTEWRIDALRSALQSPGWDGPIYLQEENRYGMHVSADAPATEFFEAAAGALAGFGASEGGAGWCFHNDAGFYLYGSSLFGELGAVAPSYRAKELQIANELAAALGL